MHGAHIPAGRLPRKAASNFFDNITLGYLVELALYFRDELYRIFFFIIDLLSLGASL